MNPQQDNPEVLVAIPKRIALTGLLSGSLGLALYAGFAAASGHPATPFILALLLATPLAGLCLWQVVDGLRTGSFVVWRGTVRRDERPAAFWFNMAWYSLCALALAAIAAWSGWRLGGASPGI